MTEMQNIEIRDKESTAYDAETKLSRLISHYQTEEIELQSFLERGKEIEKGWSTGPRTMMEEFASGMVSKEVGIRMKRQNALENAIYMLPVDTIEDVRRKVKFAFEMAAHEDQIMDHHADMILQSIAIYPGGDI